MVQTAVLDGLQFDAPPLSQDGFAAPEVDVGRGQVADALVVAVVAQLTRIPGKSDLAKALRYVLNRWDAFTLFLDDGRIAIDNNAAERAIKPVVIGRKNFIFAGSDAGGETLASAMIIIETAKFNGLNPRVYLADIFARIHDHKINRIDKLLPWNWKPGADQTAAA